MKGKNPDPDPDPDPRPPTPDRFFPISMSVDVVWRRRFENRGHCTPFEEADLPLDQVADFLHSEQGRGRCHLLKTGERGSGDSCCYYACQFAGGPRGGAAPSRGPRPDVARLRMASP